MQIKDAVQQASLHLTDVFEAAAGRELRLEGLEKTDDSVFWQITFSYIPDSTRTDVFAREYKTVKLRDSTGEFMGVQNSYLKAA